MSRQSAVPDAGRAAPADADDALGSAMVVGPAVFRNFMASFPTGVSVVTTYDCDTAPRGFTCSSLSSVTLSPPTLLVCANNSSGTLGAVRASLRFAVNLLHSKAEHTARVFASGKPDRFEQVPWRPSEAGGLPHLHEDAHTIAECRLVDTHIVGTHTVLFGEVEAVLVSNRPVDGAPTESPLLYCRQQFTKCPTLTGRW